MKNEYRSHDLYLSSILISSKKLTLKKLEKNGKHIIFVFDDPGSEAESIIKSCVNRRLMVNGLDLIEAIKLLKNRIYLGI